MKSRISFKPPLRVAGILVISFFLTAISFFVLDAPAEGSYAKPAATPEIKIPQNLIKGNSPETLQAEVFTEQAELPPGWTSPGLPMRLKIPKIKVDAAIKHVSLTADGAMGVTKSPADVAWFRLGARPGGTGSAVIAGHYGWTKGIPAAFDNLSKLRKGDKIYVKDDKGATIIFVVREVRRYDAMAEAAEIFGSTDGKEHLNLITCEGSWNKNTKQYSKRLVVFADKE